MSYSIIIYFIIIKTVINQNTVPTFFHRRHVDGSFVDRANKNEFNAVLERTYKSLLGAGNSTLLVVPRIISNNEKLTVSWNIDMEPSRRDWIGLFCPKNGDLNDVLDYFEVTVCTTWDTGQGSHTVLMYNLRTDCQFRYYLFDKNLIAAVSNTLTFHDEEPLQGHISLTRNPGEMRVTWVSGTGNYRLI